jgi:hypothetical protein
MTDDGQVGQSVYPPSAVRHLSSAQRRAVSPYALVLRRLIGSSTLSRTRLPVRPIVLVLGEPTRGFLKSPPDGFQNFSWCQVGHGEVL